MSWLLLRLRRVRLLRLHSARGSAPVSSLPSSSSFSSADTFWNAASSMHRCQHPRCKTPSLPLTQAVKEDETAEDNGPTRICRGYGLWRQATSLERLSA